MVIEKEVIKSVTLTGEEVNQLWRLVKNECEGSESVEGTTYKIYCELSKYFYLKNDR